MTFCQNNSNNLCISPHHYIEKMVESYKWMFNESPPSKATPHLTVMTIQKSMPLSS
jgi:hypothetical protein